MKYYDCFAYEGIGYEKLFHHKSWRIAILNYIEELDLDRLSYFEAHLETDEVFVLLEGTCHLFFIDPKREHPEESVNCLPLKRNKIYSVPKGIYHTHTLSKDAKILVIEEENTCDDNSPRLMITKAMKKAIHHFYKEKANDLETSF